MEKIMTLDEMRMEENYWTEEGTTETGIKYRIKTNNGGIGIEYYGVEVIIEFLGIKKEDVISVVSKDVYELLKDTDVLLEGLGYYRNNCYKGVRDGKRFDRGIKMNIGDELIPMPDYVYNDDCNDGYGFYISNSVHCRSNFEITLRYGLIEDFDYDVECYWEDKVLESIQEGLEQLKTNKPKELKKLEDKWCTRVKKIIDELLEEDIYFEKDEINELMEKYSFKNADLEDIVGEYYESDYEFLGNIAEQYAYSIVHYGESSIGKDEAITAIEWHIENELYDAIAYN